MYHCFLLLLNNIVITMTNETSISKVWLLIPLTAKYLNSYLRLKVSAAGGYMRIYHSRGVGLLCKLYTMGGAGAVLYTMSYSARHPAYYVLGFKCYMYVLVMYICINEAYYTLYCRTVISVPLWATKRKSFMASSIQLIILLYTRNLYDSHYRCFICSIVLYFRSTKTPRPTPSHLIRDVQYQ